MPACSRTQLPISEAQLYRSLLPILTALIKLAGADIADGLVRGLDNVGIADASVFPTSGAQNPTLTLMATALRNARRWVGRPGAVAPAAAPPAGSTTASAPAVIPTTGRAVPIGLAAALGAAGVAGASMARRATDGTDLDSAER